MATRFDFTLVYDDDVYVNTYASASGLADKFLDVCKAALEKTEFPNIDLEIEEFVSGGMFFNKEKTKMLALSFKKSAFSKLGVFFRAQQFGNVVVFTKLETLESGFFDALNMRSKGEMLANIRKKCKNQAQYEEYIALRELGNLVYWQALAACDPNYESNRRLAQMAPGAGQGT